MLTPFTENHWTDEDDRPAGGCSFGPGFAISWQNGPLGRDEERLEPNGAFVETLIKAVMGRLEFYQASEFECQSNSDALDALSEALAALNSRTAEREARDVEGTHEK